MVGIRFVSEGEMPPFDSDGLEAVAHHGLAKEATMADLLGGEATGIVVVRCFAEEVIGAAHIDFALGLHVEELVLERARTRIYYENFSNLLFHFL